MSENSEIRNTMDVPSVKETPTVEARFQVWVGNLGAYNSGRLVGEWIDLPQDDLEEALAWTKKYEAKHPFDGDEWVVMDYSGFPFSVGEIGLNEIAGLNEWATMDEEDQAKAGFILWNCPQTPWKDVMKQLDSVEFIAGGTLQEMAAEHLEATLDSLVNAHNPHTKKTIEFLHMYLDVDSYAHDLGLEGWIENPAKLPPGLYYMR